MVMNERAKFSEDQMRLALNVIKAAKNVDFFYCDSIVGWDELQAALTAFEAASND